MNFKRLLYLLHRWLGIALCIFMGLWFFSGVVMMYVGYPKLSQSERLGALPVLEGSVACCISASQVLSVLPQGSRLENLRLTSIAGDPHFIAGIGRGKYLAVDARNGALVQDVDAAFALASAKAFASSASASHAGVIDEDPWTHSKGLDGHRPLHRIDVEDDDLAIVYVSGVTGEVVRDVTTVEKHWNWVGAWLHWLYPLRGGKLDPLWRDIVIYTSLAATILAILGLLIGCWRWRFKPFQHGRRSPYRQNWMRWHHWLGLIFGVLTITWVVSGLFSMNPWHLFDSGASKPIAQRLELTEAGSSRSVSESLRCLREASFGAKELEWHTFSGKTYVVARNGVDTRLLSGAGACDVFSSFSEQLVREEGARLMPHARLAAASIQSDYDWHYYDRTMHTMSGHLEKPLPVLVLVFDDPAETWLYMDLRTGRVLQRTDSHLRVKRWLFAFLHSWDWKPLLDRRPIWDILLVVASIGGFLLGVTGAVVGWRRLMR